MAEPHISAWRRSVCGDLTSAFDFNAGTAAFPTTLPATAPLVAAADAEDSLPAATAPSSSPMPGQESGDRPYQRIGYRFDTTSWTDTSTNRFWFKTVNNGALGGGFSAYTVNYRTFQAWRYTLPTGGSISDYFSALTYGGGRYDIDLHGPDGYLRGFQGDVRTWTAKAHPEAYVVDNADGATQTLHLTNAGSVACVFTVGVNQAQGASGGSVRTVTVAAGGSSTLTLGSAAGRYDYTVTANVGDGFARRFAGRQY
ncbi:phospholipase domain-containing protein [Streptacidiphilus monticola]